MNNIVLLLRILLASADRSRPPCLPFHMFLPLNWSVVTLPCSAFKYIQDHAGHIFGVDSVQMIEKLQQYNHHLEKVVEVLESQSGRGGLHENTLLLVMGDHGQTVNGDHGGGSPEEVETLIFAMTLKKPSPPVPSEFDTSSCRLDLDGRKVCIIYIEQLDFAVTVSALLGVPLPYGSMGHVNPIMYALVAGTWNLEANHMSNGQTKFNLEKWMRNYANVLCINSWQVKNYIDVYTASSAIEFSNEDLKHVGEVYAWYMPGLRIVLIP